jgi:hypothetical protein
MFVREKIKNESEKYLFLLPKRGQICKMTIKFLFIFERIFASKLNLIVTVCGFLNIVALLIALLKQKQQQKQQRI